jgi:hypothetical protein
VEVCGKGNCATTLRVNSSNSGLTHLTGRTVSSCRRLVDSFRRGSSGPSTGQSFTHGPTSFVPTSAPPNRKRSAPAETSTPMGRPLAPKQPATFPTDRPGGLLTGHQAHHPQSPLGEPAPGLTEPRKKRGRPTKKEQEERRAIHAARAQSLQSPALLSPFGPQLSRVQPSATVESDFPSAGLSLSQTSILATPRTLPPEGEHNSSSSSGKKRRGRPPKLPAPSDMEPLAQPSFAAPSQQASSAYGSPPHSATHSASVSASTTRERRASISTRSAGTTAGPPPQEQREQSEESRRQPRGSQPRSWNDTVMGASNPRQ